jgi:hypothetical protein
VSDELAVTDRAAWTLTERQLDFVWERLGLDVFPFPLECTRSGATDLERARLGTQVIDELRGLGVLDRALRLDPDLEAALRQLANPELSVDSAWLTVDGTSLTVDSSLLTVDGRLQRALATRSGRRAVLAVQDDGVLTVRDIGPTELVEEILAVLPSCAAGRWPGGRWSVEEARRDNALIARLAGRHLASGQLGATVRDGGARLRAPAIHWFDLADDGRYLVIRDGALVEVRPAAGAALSRRIAGMITRS